MTTILQVVIGLTFVFLIFSLVVTAANELVLSIFKHRSRLLQRGIGELLQDPNVAGVAKAFWAHPLVIAMSQGQNGRPSYIGGDTFVATLLDLIRKGDLQDPANPKPLTGGDFQSLIATIGNPNLRRALSALWPESGKLEDFTARLEGWFNQGMDRVSGWYKRFAHYCVFVIGILFAVGCNVDTLFITESLATDPKLRENLSVAAMDYFKTHGTLPPGTATPDSKPAPPVTPPAPDAKPAPAVPAPVKAEADADKTLDQAIKQLNQSVQDLGGLTVPIGWEPKRMQYARTHLLSAILGWLVTALAGSLGAPFWFDVLNRFMNIRAAGRSPTETQKGGRQDTSSAA